MYHHAFLRAACSAGTSPLFFSFQRCVSGRYVIHASYTPLTRLFAADTAATLNDIKAQLLITSSSKLVYLDATWTLTWTFDSSCEGLSRYSVYLLY